MLAHSGLNLGKRMAAHLPGTVRSLAAGVPPAPGRLSAGKWLAAAAGALGVVAAASVGPASAEGVNDATSTSSSASGYTFPTSKLTCKRAAAAPRIPTILVACGSFNPPTVMHLRMCELAAQELATRGHDVWGCYLSPVGDRYNKPGLLVAQHRVAMCELAAADSDKIMVDTWEASQPGYTRTLLVLQHFKDEIGRWLAALPAAATASTRNVGGASSDGAAGGASSCGAAGSGGKAKTGAAGGAASAAGAKGSGSAAGAAKAATSAAAPTAPPAAAPPPAAPAAAAPQASPQGEDVRVMLVCGADLLLSLTVPGVWEDPGALLRDWGVVCIAREGSDVRSFMQTDGNVLHEYADRIVLISDPVPNDVSSTKVRAEAAQGRSIKYLVPEPVVKYLQKNRLYAAPASAGTAQQ